jgi:peptidoglycan hydrolase FlgJ
MTTIANVPSPLLGTPDVPKDWGRVNTAANRFEAPDFGEKDELRENFTKFFGETFYGQMIKSLRSTVGKPAYFHGGQAEEVFRGQLDQTLTEHLTEATADRFAEPLLKQQFPQYRDKPPEMDFAINSDLNQLHALPRR